MSTFNNIQNALNTQLNSLGGLPDIYWPNVQNAPLVNQNFIRPTLLPARSTLYTLSEGDYHHGIYQVDIFVDLKQGTAEALLLADIVRDGFRRQSLVSSGTTVHIQEISMSTATREDNSWHVFVEINYLSVE